MIRIEDKSTLDPLNRKLYLVEYNNTYYWFRPVHNNMDTWVAVKDDSDNSEYNKYYLQVKGKITCECGGYKRAHKCRHTEILKEIKTKI
jgi:hypothetical protein